MKRPVRIRGGAHPAVERNCTQKTSTAESDCVTVGWPRPRIRMVRLKSGEGKMKTTVATPVRVALALAAALALGAPALAADYHADLRPMPVDDETKAFIGGDGDVAATFEGGALTVKG